MIFLGFGTYLTSHIKIVASPSRQSEIIMLTSCFKSLVVRTMKNLISELLAKLAEKEEESKEFVAQIEALEIVIFAMLERMERSERLAIITNIEDALNETQPDDSLTANDTTLLKKYLSRLLTPPTT